MKVEDEVHRVKILVNGEVVERLIPARTLLSDFLRDDAGLTGTHVGCEHGVCGACTVLVDGASARSCLMFAVQAQGCHVTTVEGQDEGGALSSLQTALWDHHGLQCGFCTPGVIIVAQELIDRRGAALTRREIEEGLGGNICRCTGYQHIVDAVVAVASSTAGDPQ